MDDPDADAKQSAVEARAADDEAKAAAQAAVAVGAAAAFEADAAAAGTLAAIFKAITESKDRNIRLNSIHDVHQGV